MNKIALVIILSITQFGFSQVEKKVGDFNKVTTFDKIDVLLIASDENKIILNGENAEQVEIINKNGELKISLPIGKFLKGDDIKPPTPDSQNPPPVSIPKKSS